MRGEGMEHTVRVSIEGIRDAPSDAANAPLARHMSGACRRRRVLRSPIDFCGSYVSKQEVSR